MSASRCLLLLLCTVPCITSRNTKLKEVFGWNQLDFAFPSEQARESAILTGEFIPENNLPLGFDVWSNRLFVTVPRWKSGIPATLNYVTFNPECSSVAPTLIPYPDWETNKLPQEESSESIISTFRIRVDACDRLWVMDTGVADILGEAKSYSKPKIMIYDLHTDILIRKYSFKDSDLEQHSFFANIVVDTDGEDQCSDAHAYVADIAGYGIVVYSFKENASWRVKHHYFHFDPLHGDFNVGGVNFQWADGVFGIALSRRNADGFRTAYFHAFSSLNEFAVSTEVLRNGSGASTSYGEYELLGARVANAQASASFLDEKTGVLFYTQVNLDAIGCWNSNGKTYTPENQGLVAKDNETLVFVNDLKVDRWGYLWVLSNRMQEYLFRELDPNQINFRVFTAQVAQLIRDTVCDEDAVEENYW